MTPVLAILRAIFIWAAVGLCLVFTGILNPAPAAAADECFKVEGGVIECDPWNPGAYIYNMTIGAEFGGKVVELIADDPAVVVFPASQVVPAGGGVLQWHIHGATPGSTLTFTANGLSDGDVKHVSGPDEGLGLCCVSKFEIVIPVQPCPGVAPGPADCPEGEECANLLVEKFAEVDSCTKAGGCKFRIKVTSTGPGPYTGRIVLDEWQTPLDATIIGAANAPWVCANPPVGLQCTHPVVTLNPGEFKELLLEFAPGPAWPDDVITNCATYNAPESGKDPFGNLLDDHSCATLPICEPGECAGAGPAPEPGEPVLEINKVYASDEAPICQHVENGLAECTYLVTIVNTGNATYIGSLNVADEFTNGPVHSFDFHPNPPWTCVEDGGLARFKCDRNIVLPPGAQDVLTVRAKVPFNDYPSRDVKNCVELDEDNRAFQTCAIGELVEVGPIDGGPPKFGNIRVEKTGADECVGREPCTFNVTVTNDDDEAFSGSAAIVDGITDEAGAVVVGARIVSIEPPLGCEVAPVTLPFGCVAQIDLGAGESRTHKVTVELPELTGEEDGGSWRNCIIVNEPGVLDADVEEIVGNADDSGDTPAAVRTGCHVFNSVKQEKKQDNCTNGMVANSVGLCECPSGTSWNGRRCFGEIVDPVLPVFPQPEGRTPVCPRGWDQFKSLSGKPLGYHLEYKSSYGERIICGEPQCDSGWSLFESSANIPRSWDKRLIGRSQSRYKFWCARAPRGCTPGRNEVRRDGYCICVDGYHRDNYGECVKVVSPPLLECWRAWDEINSTQVSAYRHKGYSVKRRTLGRQSIWCAQEGEREKLEPCPRGFTKFPRGKEPRGWISVKRYYDNGRSVCAKEPKDPPFVCWSGWTTISGSERSQYEHKGYSVKSRSRKGLTIWCAIKRGNGTQCERPRYLNKNGKCTCGPKKRWNGKSCISIDTCKKPRYTDRSGKCTCGPKKVWDGKTCRGKDTTDPGKGCGGDPNATYLNGSCVCKSGYKRSHGRCVKSDSGSGPKCNKPRYLDRKGNCTCGPNKKWTGKSCKSINEPSCKDKGMIGKYPNCKPKREPKCSDKDMVGKYPNCKPKKQPKCSDKGMVGKYPNCKPKKQPKCSDKGMVGKYPNCKSKKQPKCSDKGMVGKYPNCKSKSSPIKGPDKKKKKKKVQDARKQCQALGMRGRFPNCKPKKN